jgi:hypothetical protein
MSRLSHIAACSLSILILGCSAMSAFAAGTASTTTLSVMSVGSLVTTVASGTVVTLQATVAAGAQVTPGTVQFCDTSVNATCTGAAFVASAQLTAAGTATVLLRLGIGSHTLVAKFSGTATYLASSSAASALAVTGTHASTTALTYYGSAGNYYFIPVVTGQSFSSLTPTGSLSINDVTSSTTLATTPLAGATIASSLGFSNTTLTSTSTGATPTAIAVGDFNGDGILDMAVANNTAPGTVTVLLGTAAGTFQIGVSYATGNQAFGVAVGDLNSDGILDLVVVNQADNTVSVLLGKGDGTFPLVSPATAYPTYATGVKPEPPVLADVNGDGILDLLVANFTDNTVGVLLGNGDGTFQPMQTYATGTNPQQIAVADFNGDGIPDMVVSNYDSTSVSVLLGVGDGTFQPQTLVNAGDLTNGVATADFNGDGKADLAVMQGDNGTVAILLGNGNGTFRSPVTYAAIGTQEFPFVADVNGDGKLDIVCPSFQSSQMAVLLGNGDGSFQAPLFFATGASNTNDEVMAIGDFNGDGMLDFAVPNESDSTVTVLANSSSVTATLSAQISATPSIVGDVAQAVYSGDPNFATSTSSSVTLSSNMAATTLALTSSANRILAGTSVTLTATLSPATLYGMSTNGELVTFYNGANPLGTGTLTSGVATLTTNALPQGTDSLYAIYAGDTYLAASTSATISQYMQGASVTSLSITSGGTAASTVAQGTVITLTASATVGGVAVTQGTITFCDTAINTHCTGSAFLGTAQLLSAGTATLSTRLGVGTHTLTASLLPANTTVASTSSPASLTVTGLVPSATTLQYHGSVGNYVLSPAVAALYASSTSGPPTGSVQILDTSNGNNILATSSLASGISSASQVFAAQTAPPVGATPVSIAVGDFNGDGVPDIVVANQTSHSGPTSTVSILLMNPDGTVLSTTIVAVARTPNGVAVGDFNHDGKLDIAVASSSTFSGKISILLGNGDGTFQPQADYTTVAGPAAIAVGDLNGDGILDLVVTSYTTNQVSVLLGNGDGTFQAQSQFSTNDVSYAIALADLNGDGFLDIVRSDVDFNFVSVQLGNGDGTFGPEQSYIAGNEPVRLTLGDFNGDGKIDVATANAFDNTVSVLLGKGDGTFHHQTTYASGNSPDGITAADFDGDGKVDLAAINYTDNTLSFFAGKGDGTFQAQQTYAVGGGPQAIALGDFNGDGKPDVLTANSTDNTVSLLLNTAGITITLPDIPLTLVNGSTHVVEASYSGNTVYNPSVSPTVSLSSNLYQPAVTVSANSIFPAQGASVTLTATLAPYAGSEQTTNGETVTFSANGSAIGTGLLTSGTATLTLSSLTLGANSISASYAGDTYFAAASSTNNLTVTVTSPTTTVLAPTVGGSTEVTSAPAGTMLTLVADVETASAGTVNFCDISVNAACTGSALLGSAQIVSGSSGITTLNVHLGIGSHSLTAMYLGDSSAGPSTSAAMPLTITGQRATSTSLTASGSSGDYLVTAAITGAGPLGIPMTGDLALQDTTASVQVADPLLTSGVTNYVLSFVPSLTAAAGSLPASITDHIVADFNGDGIPDIAYTDASASQIGIATGIGDGTFNTPALAGTGGLPFALAAGDFDNDGRLDAIEVNASDQTVWVLPGNGDGTLQPQKITTLSSPTYPVGVAVADLNKDGNLDAAILTQASTEAYVVVLLGQGDGTFQATQNTYDIGPINSGEASSNIVIADVNNDGVPDILALSNANSTLQVLLGNGDGTFQAAKPYATAAGPVHLATADLNRDGNIDVIVAAGPSAGVASVLLGKGDGSFQSHVDYAVGNSPADITAGDFNGDGKIDVAVSNSVDSTVSTLLGNGDGTLKAQQTTAVSGEPFSIAPSDLNGDGQMDLTVLTDGGSEVSALLNTGTVTDTITLSGFNVPGSGTHQVQANYSGDTVYAPSSSSPFGFATGTYTTTLTLGSSGTPVPAGTSVTLTATLSPHVGAGLSTDGESVSFYINGTTLLGTGSLSSGTATYTTTTLPTGADQLTANYAGDTYFNAAVSSAFTQTVGAIPVIAWTPSTLTVYNGNTIGAGVLDATSTTPGTFTYTATPAGGSAAAVSALTVLAPGTYTLTATLTPTDTTTYAPATANIAFLVAAQDVWILNSNGSLSELNDAGVPVSSSPIISGGTGTALHGGIAFDSTGQIWSVNSATNQAVMADKTGVTVNILSTGSLNAPAALAVDGIGQVWIANGNNSVTLFSNAGTPVTPVGGYTGGSINTLTGIAIDISGNVWISNSGNNSVTEILGGAAPASPLDVGTQNATLGTRP